jgi:hypothetical protein
MDGDKLNHQIKVSEPHCNYPNQTNIITIINTIISIAMITIIINQQAREVRCNNINWNWLELA